MKPIFSILWHELRKVKTWIKFKFWNFEFVVWQTWWTTSPMQLVQVWTMDTRAVDGVGQGVRDITLSCSGIPFQDQRESGFIPPEAGDSALSWWPSAETALSEETPAASGSPPSPSTGTLLSLHHGPTSPLARSSFLLLAGVGSAK